MKRNLLKIICLVLASAILLCGCGGATEQTITSNGMSMTISGSMKDITKDSGYTFAYASSNEAVIGLYEAKAEFEAYGLDPTLEEYCDLVIQGNGMETEATKNGDLLTFTFDSVVDGEDYSYLAAVYEGAEGFWLIQCGSKSADFDKHYNSFLTYLNSVQP